MTATEPATKAAPTSRLAFIDNLRWSMIVLVISMHAADTYSPFGNWYYGDKAGTGRVTALAFGTYQSFLQAFFMALLFAVSGYFAAASIRRKGAARFVVDRCWRLGVPVLLYMLVIGPITQYYVAGSWRPSRPSSFAHEWLHHILDGEVFSESGPLWFCVALLIFCAAYAAIWSLRRERNRQAAPRSDAPPSLVVILCFIGVMTVATFVARLFIRDGDAVLNLQIGDFPSYVLMFAAGIEAQSRQWPFKLPAASGARWAIAGIGLGLVGFVAIILLGGALEGNLEAHGGGWHWPAFFKDLWESYVCVAMSLGLLVLYRERFNEQGRVARFLSDNAFAAYVFHPPILIAVTRLLHLLDAPQLFKFLIATLVGAALTLLFSALVARRTPLLRGVL